VSAGEGTAHLGYRRCRIAKGLDDAHHWEPHRMSAVDRVTDFDEFSLGSILLHDCSEEDAARAVRTAAIAREALAVHLCNAYTLTLAARDEEYANRLRRRSLNLTDGTPVTWYYRALTGRASRGPVRGPAFMRRMLAEPDLTHFLYGGTSAVLAALEGTIARAYPRARVVGSYAPPFGPLRDEDFALLSGALSECRPHLVWVGLGTPKQDILVDRLANEAGAVAVGVGAAFDFLSGMKKEAPGFLHQTGLEWVHRLATEPRRLWRRYLFGNAAFVRLAAQELVRGRRRRSRT
jgi:N-acetylglucosaminyldiphosphoundecaprenol N-acetyl-beta-D-mannosaminyltransferase